MTRRRVVVTRYADRPLPTLAAVRAWKGRKRTGTRHRQRSGGVWSWVLAELGVRKRTVRRRR